MNIQHPQETVIKTYDYNGIGVDLIEWSETIWCGKVGYADNNTDEPNVEKIMEDSVKNKFFTRQICAYAQIRRFW